VEDPALSSIRHFVQEVLGCGCPEEVFRRVGLETASLEGVKVARIEVGGRLLVEVFDTDDAQTVAQRLGGWIAAAVAERDARGFNRARIVIATGRPERMQGPVQEAFAAIRGRDDRTHLHVVDRCLCRWQTC
jgi:hypothetical protein